jgi:hypothetical protein
MMCAMLKIKPLLDEMYSEMCVLYEEKERWKREASELRGELESIRNTSRISDECYASEATAAPRSEVGSARAPAVSSQESAKGLTGSCEVSPVKEENESEDDVFNFGTDTVKNVVISENNQKCEDRKEYYRMYRLKQKELKASKK